MGKRADLCAKVPRGGLVPTSVVGIVSLTVTSPPCAFSPSTRSCVCKGHFHCFPRVIFRGLEAIQTLSLILVPWSLCLAVCSDPCSGPGVAAQDRVTPVGTLQLVAGSAHILLQRREPHPSLLISPVKQRGGVCLDLTPSSPKPSLGLSLLAQPPPLLSPTTRPGSPECYLVLHFLL